MEIIVLGLQACEVPAHSNVASLVISLSSIPALHSHTIQSGECDCTICAATAVKENQIVFAIVHQLKILRDGAWRNLRQGRISSTGIRMYFIPSLSTTCSSELSSARKLITVFTPFSFNN